MQIALTRTILMPRLWFFATTLTIHILICLYLVTYFLRVTVSLCAGHKLEQFRLPSLLLDMDKLKQNFHMVSIIIIIIKKDWQCKAGRGRLTPYQSEDPSPTLPTYRRKEEKGKRVEGKKGESN